MKHLILAHSEFLTTLQVHVELIELPSGQEVNSIVTKSTTNVTFTIGIIFYSKERERKTEAYDLQLIRDIKVN